MQNNKLQKMYDFWVVPRGVYRTTTVRHRPVMPKGGRQTLVDGPGEPRKKSPSGEGRA
jgi:hypothetical protein